MDGAGHFTAFAVILTLCCLHGEGCVVRGAEVGTDDLKQGGGRLGYWITQCPWVSGLTCSFLRVTLDKALKFLFHSSAQLVNLFGGEETPKWHWKSSGALHCPFRGKQIIPPMFPPAHHWGLSVCPLRSPVEKPGCNMNYTNGAVAYSDIVQCLFISQNVCTVLITVFC